MNQVESVPSIASKCFLAICIRLTGFYITAARIDYNILNANAIKIRQNRGNSGMRLVFARTITSSQMRNNW